MRVAVVASKRMVNSVYRAMPLLELRRVGMDVVLDDEGAALSAGRLRGFDVVHIYRYHDRVTRRMARALRGTGSAIIWDNDDELREERGTVRTHETNAHVAEMLQLAHLVTTTSPVLAAHYRASGAEEVHVVENFLPDQYAAERPPRGNGVVVGWTAAYEHAADAEALGIRETLERLLDAHPHVRVVSAGFPLGIASDRYEHTHLVQYRDLARFIGEYDIGIAPIADVPFNRAKSDVKVKEYAAMGVPWLASPIGPYAGLGEKQGGRLVPDDRWDEQLRWLVRDERARRKLAKRGLKWANGQRLRHNLGSWEAAVRRAHERAHAPAPTAR